MSKHLNTTFLLLLVCLAALFLVVVDVQQLEVFVLRLASPRDAHEKTALERLLTGALLHKLRYAVAAGIVLTGVLPVLLWQPVREMAAETRSYVLDLRQSVVRSFGVLLLVAFVAAIVLAFVLPVHHDEAYSYLYYAGKGPLVAMSLYNSTNNHLFFNVLASLPAAVFPDPVVGMRMVSVVAAMLLLAHLHLFLRSEFGANAALVATMLIAVSYPLVYYACHARGYMFATLLGAWAFTGLYAFAMGRSERLHWFILASVLGAYTMPVFVYFFAPLIPVALVFTDGVRRLKLLRAVAWVGAGVLLLYTPVFLLNGWGAVHHNEQVLQLETGVAALTYPQYLLQLGWYLGFPTVYPLLAVASVFLAYHTRKPLYVFVVATCLTPPLVPLLQGVYPPDRVFTPLLMPLAVVLAAGAQKWPKSMAIAVFAVFLNLRLMFLNESYPKAVEQLYLKGLSTKITQRIYIHDHPTLRVLLLYHNRIGGEPLKIDYSRTFSSLDSTVLSGGYDRVFSRLPAEGFAKKEFWYEK